VNASWPATRRWLANSHVARHIVEAIFRARCRRLLARFERLEASRCQIRTLLGLVHRAHRTPFGGEHDFRRIRTVDDFRRLVPLRNAAELRRFPQPPVAPLADAARLTAVATGLALAARERPLGRLFDGSFVLLGDDINLPDDPARVLPVLVQPFANVRGKVTCLIGSADRLTRYLEVCRPDDRVTPLALLYTPSPGVSLERLRARLSPDVLVLELGFRPEAAVAVEDPRLRSSRLLTDHGVFFEFVPAAERNTLFPDRLIVEEVETGPVYEIVITAPGGWWACRTGAGIRFEKQSPALVRFVPLPPISAPSINRTPLVTVAPVLQSHPRTSGTAAGLPGSSAHIPWSAPAGRG
jgi:hypothetical protein